MTILHHRPVTEADFEALHRLYNLEPGVNHQIGWDTTDEAGFRPIFDELVASGEQFVVCDEGGDGGAVIGAYRVHRFKHRMRHVAHIASVGLTERLHGRGLGRRMIRGIIDRLRATEGVKRIELTVAADNPRAIRLYESLGFTREGVLPRYFLRAGEDEYKDEIAMGMWVGESD